MVNLQNCCRYYVFGSIFLFLYVCYQHYSKCYKRIAMKFYGESRVVTKHKLLNFGGDHCYDLALAEICAPQVRRLASTSLLCCSMSLSLIVFLVLNMVTALKLLTHTTVNLQLELSLSTTHLFRKFLVSKNNNRYLSYSML